MGDETERGARAQLSTRVRTRNRAKRDDGMDVGAMATTRGALLAGEWLTSLIMFSTMASASKHNDSARQYVVAIGVIMWLLTSAIAVCYLLSYQHELPLIHLDHQGPVLQITGKLTLELVYYAVFGFLSLVAFFCAASHANGSGAAAASAFFSVVLTIGTIASCFITYRELSEEMSSSGPILNPGQPASVSQPAPGVTTQF